jgi:single-strand DNA-binding protein
MNVNLCVFAGRVGGSPEVKQINDKFKTCVFSLAVNKRVKNQAGEYEDKTLWLRCKCYNSIADIVAKYVNKGDMLYVHGSIDIDSWTDKDGQKQSITFIQVESVQLFPKAKEGANLQPTEMADTNRNEPEPEHDDLPF